MKKIYLLLVLFVTSSFNILGQCNTNTTICTPGIAGPFSFQNASNNPSTCLDFINGANTPNYAYIILYITQGGTLNLLINGNNTGPFSNSCLDVALFDITNTIDPCASLSPLTEIGCNYVFPCEGCAEFGTNINGCAAQEPAPIVQTGDVIMILVEDYSDLQTSFTLQLASGPGSAQTGPPDATITPIAPICNNAPSLQLAAANGGGTWTGSGVSTSGVFNPAVAGIGFHVITYTLGNPPCQSTSQTTIEVINCNECTFTNIAANISACNPATNSFGVTGSVSFTEPPTTGQLIITTCNGVQQTFSAPFTSPLNYNLSNIPANGQSCNVTATFSADTDCTISFGNFTAPACACFFTFIETNISACDGLTNTFEITGSVQFDSPPSTGTLIISDCNGNDQVFNAPFTSPTNYALTGITAGGTIDCEVTAVFSADTDCTISSSLFDYPPACDCPADIGTFTNSVIGMTNLNVPYNLCFNDELSITANGDYTPASPSATGSITYDPGIWLLVYECPPTIGTPDDINDDPCLLGVASTNDGAWTIINDIGDGETFYFVPITMYSMEDSFYSSTNSLVNCYDLGPVYAVTYLPEMVSNHTTDCQNSSVTATVSGGTPANNGSLFTAQNLVPVNASFDNTTAANNGTIVVSGLNDGDNYSFDIIDQNGCFVTVSGVFEGADPVELTYPFSQYCVGQGTASPTINGVLGGTFSSSAGLALNPSTGLINLVNSAPGTYTINYQTPDPICFSTDTYTLTINPIFTNTINQSVCANELPVVISGLNFSQAGQQTVNLASSNGCDSILTINLTVLPLPQPDFIGSNLTGCAPLTASFQNTTLGQFNNCFWNFGTGVSTNGCGTVSHTFNQAGCYDITLTLTSQQGCMASFIIEDMICVTPTPIADFTPIPNIMTTANPTTDLINTSTNAQNYLWIFGDNSGSSAEFSPSHTYPDVGGQYTITLYAYNGNCVDTATHTVFVNSEAIFYVPNTFTPDNDKFNQTFQPVFTSGFDVFNFNLLIFNRWGEVLFESNNAEIGWDGTYGGKLCKDGTYIWQITFKESGKEKRNVIRGHLNLLK